jgi:hypothetical protein
VRPKKSRKPSATSALPPDPTAKEPTQGGPGESPEGESPRDDATGETRPVLFLDRAIDGHALATALIEAGADIRRHRDEFRHDEDDAVWLPEVGRRGWFVLTRDARIRYNPFEIQALKAAGVGAFIFVAKNFTGPEIAATVAGALPAIERATRRNQRPFIIRIYRDGTLKKIEIEG